MSVYSLIHGETHSATPLNVSQRVAKEVAPPQNPEGEKKAGQVSDYTPQREAWGREDVKLSNRTIETMKKTLISQVRLVIQNRRGGSSETGINSLYLTDVHKTFLTKVAETLKLLDTGGNPDPLKVTVEVLEKEIDRLLQSPKMQLVAMSLINYERLGLQLAIGQQMCEPRSPLSRLIRTVSYGADRRRHPDQHSSVVGGAGFTMLPADLQAFESTLFDRDGFKLETNRGSGIPQVKFVETNIPDSQLRDFIKAQRTVQTNTPSIWKLLPNEISGTPVQALEQRLNELIYADLDLCAATGMTVEQMRKRINLIDKDKKSIKLTSADAHFLGEHIDSKATKDILEVIQENMKRWSDQAKGELTERWKKERETMDRQKLYEGALAGADTILTAPEAKRTYKQDEIDAQKEKVEVIKLYKDAVIKDKEHEDTIKSTEEEGSRIGVEITIWESTFRAEAILIDSAHFNANGSTLDQLNDPDPTKGYIKKTEREIKSKEQVDSDEILQLNQAEDSRKFAEERNIGRLKRAYEEANRQKIDYEGDITEHRRKKSELETQLRSDQKVLITLTNESTQRYNEWDAAQAALKGVSNTDPQYGVLIQEEMRTRMTHEANSREIARLTSTTATLPTTITETGGLITDIQTVKIPALDTDNKFDAWQQADETEKRELKIQEAKIARETNKREIVRNELEGKKQRAITLLGKKADVNGKSGGELWQAREDIKNKIATETARRAETRKKYNSQLSSHTIPSTNIQYALDQSCTTNVNLISAIATKTDHLNVPLKDIPELEQYMLDAEDQLQKMQNSEGTSYDKDRLLWIRNQAEQAKLIVAALGPASTTTTGELPKRIDRTDDPDLNKLDWIKRDVWNRYSVDVPPGTTSEISVHVAPVFVKLYKILGGEDIFVPANKKKLDGLMHAYTPDMLLGALAPLNASEYYNATLFAGSGTNSNRGLSIAMLLKKDDLVKLIETYLQDVKMNHVDIYPITGSQHRDNESYLSIKPDQTVLTSIKTGTGPEYLNFVKFYQTFWYYANIQDLARRIIQQQGSPITDKAVALAYSTAVHEERKRQGLVD